MPLRAACVCLLLLATTGAYGQEQPGSRHVTGKQGAAGAQVLINEVNTDQYPRVQIFATVLKDGVPLRGLGAADFRVREDEVDQEPLTVAPQLPPLSVVLTLDTSGSMAKRMQAAQAAAMRFLDTLGGGDSAQVVTFAREVRRLTAMSTDRQAVREAIGRAVARGDTALYDALYDSIGLVRERAGRKAIVLLSDGVDDDGTGKPLSKHTMQDVVGLARDINVPIYILGLGTEIDEAGLAAVAEATGGLYFKAPQASDLQALYQTIGAQLAGQYAITYTSSLPADGSERRVDLTAQEVTASKAYKAAGGSGTAAAENPRARGADAPCYDAAAMESLDAKLRKITDRYAKGLLASTERDRQQRQLVNELDHLMAQGSGTAACLQQQLGLVYTLYNGGLITSVQRDASRKVLHAKLHDGCLTLATDVPPIAKCLKLMHGTYEQGFIDSTQRDASRQVLWQALHELLVARARADTEIDQAFDVVKQLYEQGLITSVQRDETRRALSEK
ncbi:VWA domain-containing protein [Vineibacter terrae]|uniref:vWA domain-containing protein n=1 Tax=Vineibacter terrae TaxID=2586908 RepID=UPI002E314CF1|nr:VWA domain-containing protein [Vineibacter terrae]HEX2884970.1 VWA domain-containing protein [Vineibacter terrae]